MKKELSLYILTLYKPHREDPSCARAGELHPVPALRLRVLEQELIGGTRDYWF